MKHASIASRFRKFLPVVIDLETGGFNPQTDAILELSAITLKMNEEGLIDLDQHYHYHIEPFPNANIEPASLAFTGIQPDHPFRFAVSEKEAFHELFKGIRKEIKQKGCQRAVFVAHNTFFDLNFIRCAIERNNLKRSPFHSFTAFDTATLSAAAFGQTVLATAVQCAGVPFDNSKAHSAIYDATVTAQLFCHIINQFYPDIPGNQDEKD